MRSALIISVQAGNKSVLLSGPEVPVAKQREKFEWFSTNGLPDGVQRVELWMSGSIKPKVIKSRTTAVLPAYRPPPDRPPPTPPAPPPPARPRARQLAV